MVVNNKQSRVYTVGSIRLFPGTTPIEEEKVAELTGAKFFDELCDAGLIEIVDGAEEANSVFDAVLGTTKAKDAISLVENVLSKDDLKAIIAKDKRSSVVKAAEKQLAELEGSEE